MQYTTKVPAGNARSGEKVSTHGVRGEMKALPLCDGVAFLTKFKRAVQHGRGRRRIRSCPCVRARADGRCSSWTALAIWTPPALSAGRVFYLAQGRCHAAPGPLLCGDLIGCEVADADTGQVYGRVTSVEHPAAQDIYTVTRCGRGGAHAARCAGVCQDHRLERYILVTPIAGMFTDAVNGDEG